VKIWEHLQTNMVMIYSVRTGSLLN